MATVALIGNKGGTGKTTLALNLGSGLLRRAPTVLLDADPQRSALQWHANSDGGVPEVVGASDELETQIERARDRYANVVIDCPPSILAPQLRAALNVCDLAVVPVQPSPVDLWANASVGEAVEEMRRVNHGLSAVLVVNQLEPRTILSRLARDAMAELNLPAAQTSIRRRAVYRWSAMEGKSVYQMGKRGSAAAAEMDQLIDEVIDR